jgi:hypothetical protein
MKTLIYLKQTILPFLVTVVLACFACLPQMKADPQVAPPPDGCYPGFTTAEGCRALQNLTTGTGNTGVGWRSLFSVVDANFNTGVGAGTLVLNTGDSNTAVGTAALLLNTTGTENTSVGSGALVYNDSGSHNNAVGGRALFNNLDGNGNNAFGTGTLFGNVHSFGNTAIGNFSLFNNDSSGNATANFNTAVGSGALGSNTDGDSNTAVGSEALFNNTIGYGNTATGYQALNNNNEAYNTATGYQAMLNNFDGYTNTAHGAFTLMDNISGRANTAVGTAALEHNTDDFNTAVGSTAMLNNTTGFRNTAVGDAALENLVSGYDNIAIGLDAGFSLNSGEAGNIDIDSSGVAGENSTTRIGTLQTRTFIAGIHGVSEGGQGILPVYINSAGQLGTSASSRRFKKEIQPMDKGSEVILQLKPVTFQYRNDNASTPQFGLIAEEVAEVNPDLVVRDKEGQIYTVRYDAVNAMLLNEFLKEHRTVQELKSNAATQEAAIAQQQKQIEALTAGLQKVSAQLEAGKPAQRVVNNP